MKKKIHLLGALMLVGSWACNTNQMSAGDNGAATSTAVPENFNEQHRPQFHFTPPANWMNDPNGMVYHNGEYHLFYQHNPDSTVWGPMHWGHAVSKDMISWEHLPIALYPDSLGTIFSGSAVVDVNNTSGLGTKENPAMVAIYTYHNADAERAGRNDFQTQGIAFSLDNGRNWTKYKKNPVLPNPGIRDFRDPKVSWHEAGQKWIMTLAVADRISFYSSKNLKEWQHESDFGADIGAHGGVWECPDLFKMPVEGSNEEKWVLLVSINPGGPNGGSATQYFVGDFDGKKFVLDKQFQQDLSKKSSVPGGKVLADFEGRNYGNWKAEGNAFGSTPATGALGNQQKVSGYEGKGLVNSFRNGDAATGKLTSPMFTVDADYINLLVGGGKHPEGTAVNLLVNGKIVRSTTGNNSEALNWVAWRTDELKGKKARIEIVDNVKDSWGHILVDQIILAAEPAKESKDGIWLDYGRDNYAGVTWANVPGQDDRRLFMGWMSNWDYANVVPTESWRSAMTIARTLELENTPAGLRVVSKPVEELQKLYTDSYSIKEQTVSGSVELTEGATFTTPTFDLKLGLEQVKPGTSFAIELSNKKGQKVLVGYDAARQEYYIDRTNAGDKSFSDNFAGIQYAPKLAQGSTFDLRLVADVASIELFADSGKTTMTSIFFPDEVFTLVRLITDKGSVKVKSGKMTKLASNYNVAK